MHVAELSLRKELYELSGWGGDAEYHSYVGRRCGNSGHQSSNRKDCNMYCDDIPAYSLSYLLRKLPPRIVLSQRAGNSWDADCYCGQINGKEVVDTSVYAHADTPENAATKLCIELFKQKILTRES